MNCRVKPLAGKYAGRGIAALDESALDTLDIDNGAVVRIDGPDGQLPALASQASFGASDPPIVGIDGQTRQATGAGIDDQVTVEPVDATRARRLQVSVPEDLTQDTDTVRSVIGEALNGRPVMAGQTIPVELGIGGPEEEDGIPVHIAETDPGGIVIVADRTTITVGEDAEAADLPDVLAGLQVTYEDIGGLEDELERVREMIELPTRFPELFRRVRTQPPKGVLLHGPPGTGKTLIARAVANEVDAHFQMLSGPEIVSKYHGESEEQLREVFEEAAANAPAIIFIDEIDSIAPRRDDASGGVETRIVAQLLSVMDGLGGHGQVTVIGTTNRIDAVDPALRRAGRFDREIEVGPPDRPGREEILRIHTRGMPLADDVELPAYADRTHGFVGADLKNLVREASMNALRRVRPTLDPDAEDGIDRETLTSLVVTHDDFTKALRGIEPSALREVVVEVPNVGWDDVGGLQDAKARLQEAVQWPLTYPDAYDRVDLDPTTGILLYGPPGTGKTLLARAVAGEGDSNFISVKGPELLDKYVGESEKGIREVFETARENAPTVIFFDEIDAIAVERGSDAAGSSAVSERVVSQLLTELDGLEELKGVVVIAATNRPDLIDEALLRPGRLERHIEVGEPDKEARKEIFAIHTQDRPLARDVNLGALASRTDGFVGADIEAVCRMAATAAVREYVKNRRSAARHNQSPPAPENITLTADHFSWAMRNVSPQAE